MTAMDIYDLILSRRTIRQFDPKPVPREVLEKLVNAARLAPSAANLQPLEYVVVDDEGLRKKIFPWLKWAASIAPAGNPRPGHEPQAYIFILVNRDIREKMYEYDVGAAIENMALTALGEGVASAWLISIDKPRIIDLLRIPERFELDAVLALGYPGQASLVEDLTEAHKKYWQDPDLTFHVPKRRLVDILHINKF
jgi:nitroreductase